MQKPYAFVLQLYSCICSIQFVCTNEYCYICLFTYAVAIVVYLNVYTSLNIDLGLHHYKELVINTYREQTELLKDLHMSNCMESISYTSEGTCAFL